MRKAVINHVKWTIEHFPLRNLSSILAPDGSLTTITPSSQERGISNGKFRNANYLVSLSFVSVEVVTM